MTMRAKILSASAGSGKTYQLAYKYVYDTIRNYEEKPYLYRAILAVTFTNKATEEMKSRILREIDTLASHPERSNYMPLLLQDPALNEALVVNRARAVRSKILHDYSHFTVLTIDKFFQRILRAFIKELGIDLNYNIEIETASLLAKSADALIDDISRDETLKRWITGFAEENMDENRMWNIRGDILSLGKELFDESAKRAIMNAVPKDRLMEMLRAAGKRLAAADAEMKSLAAQAVAQMDAAGVERGDVGKYVGFMIDYLRSTAAGVIAAPAKSVRNKAEQDAPLKGRDAVVEPVRGITARIVAIYDSTSRLRETVSLMRKTYRSYALLGDIYAKIGEQCREQGVMLLSETKYILSRFIADNDAPFIYEKTGNSYERFMIDEFQDTSFMEWCNFLPLLRNAMSQSEDTSVLIVGDVKQSIYRWRGGDWRILQQEASRQLGEADTETCVLSDNYRSLPRVVEFNNMITERVVEADNTSLNAMLRTAAEEGRLSAAALKELTDTLQRAYAGHAQTPRRHGRNEGYVRVERFDGEPPLVECIESIVSRGYSYGDIMILYRSNIDGARAARILLEYKRRNNSFNIMTQDALVVGSASVSSFVIAVMRLSQRSDDAISRVEMNAYLGRDYDAALTPHDVAVLSYISQLTPEAAFEKIVSEYGLDTRTEDTAYLQAVHEQVVSFCASKVADIQLFLKMWDERGANRALSAEQGENTIELTTIHKAKGLEKKVVIMPYCKWALDPASSSDQRVNIVWAEARDGEMADVGRFPVKYASAMTASSFSDEYYREKVYSHVDAINMLYVGLTRAKEALYVFVPVSKRSNIGTLLWNVAAEDPEADFVEYGTASGPEPDKGDNDGAVRNVIVRGYPTSDVVLPLRLSAQRYFEDGDDGDRVPTPRSVGILMHSALVDAASAEDAERAIERMRYSGLLGEEQAQELAEALRREFRRPKVAEWFSNEWDEVRNECDIISGAAVGTRRPDRVMIRGDRAVVVDYKFGSDRSGRHVRQVAEYMRLMAEMGYKRVEGYVWYISLGEIVDVAL